MKKTFLILLIISTRLNNFAQSNFQIRNSNPPFGFDLTLSPTKVIDTLGIILYSAESNDTTQYFAQFLKSDSSFVSAINNGVNPSDSIYIEPDDSLANPLYINRLIFNNLYESSSEIYYNDLPQADTLIKCAELGVSFLGNDAVEKQMFARIYYNGHDIYTFVIIGLKRNEDELSVFKSAFFNSIFID